MGDQEKAGQTFLKELTVEDVTERYESWMNDPDVVKYTEGRYNTYNLEDIISYVRAVESSDRALLFGIYDHDTKIHIGNIKIGPIDAVNKCASVGLIIGEKDFWGGGRASEAVRQISVIGFSDLKLHKLTAGVISGNEASLKVFLKNGFVVEGTRPKHCHFFGEWRDQILLGRINEAWRL